MQAEMLDSTISHNSQELSARIVCVLGVRGYEEDGVAHLHIEDAARGLGFERTESKNGIEYNSIRWERVEGFLAEFGFRPQVGENGNPHDYYIPENIFYRLCMKAKNEVAEKFQAKVADEIIPSIRKTGSYSVKEQPMMLPNFCNPAEAARAWADLYEKNQAIEIRALTAESERDEAIRTKAEIGSRREATAMNTASQKSKECEKLREQIGDSKTYKAAKAIPWLSEYFNTRNRGLYNALAHKLKKIEADMPSEFAHIMIDDSQYGQIKAYHVAVIEKLHEMVQADEEFMKDYRKDVSPKTKNA